MNKKTKGSRRSLDLELVEGIVKLAKKLRPPMREYSTAGQWQNTRNLNNNLYASYYPLYV